MPSRHKERSSSEPERGHPVCSTTTVRSSNPSRPLAAGRSWSGWVMISKTRSRSCRARSTSGAGRGPVRPPMGRTPRNLGATIWRSMRSDGLGDGVGRREAADDGVRPAAGGGGGVELEGLVDRVPTGGGGHVDDLLHVPLRRLGPVGGGVEPSVHPRGVTGAALRRLRQVRVPVGPGRVPQVHVGVDDPGGPLGHDGSGDGGGSQAPTTSRIRASNHFGTAGPP